MLDINPGQYAITLGRWGAAAVRAHRVTAKCVFELAYGRRERRTDRSEVIAVLDDKEAAERLLQSLDGARGECSRRRHAAEKDYNEAVAGFVAARDQRIAAAQDAYTKATERLAQEAMSARIDAKAPTNV